MHYKFMYMCENKFQVIKGCQVYSSNNLAINTRIYMMYMDIRPTPDKH